LGKDEHPVRVRSFGGLYQDRDSQQETPNVQTSEFQYADGTMLEFATRGTPTNGEEVLDDRERRSGRGTRPR
jgi:hypothetical protein